MFMGLFGTFSHALRLFHESRQTGINARWMLPYDAFAVVLQANGGVIGIEIKLIFQEK